MHALLVYLPKLARRFRGGDSPLCTLHHQDACAQSPDAVAQLELPDARVSTRVEEVAHGVGRLIPPVVHHKLQPTAR